MYIYNDALEKNTAKVVGMDYFSNDQGEAPMLWKKVSPESNMVLLGYLVLYQICGDCVQYEPSNVANVNIHALGGFKNTHIPNFNWQLSGN